MIYLIYGPDTYRSRLLVKAIIDEFQRKAGMHAPILRLDAEDQGLGALHQHLLTPSFFGTKQLFVIERSLSAKGNAFSLVQPHLKEWGKSKETTFVFWEGDIGDERANFEEIKRSAARTQEFPLLQGQKLARWLDNELIRRKIVLSTPAKRTFTERCGGDLWRLTRELEKYESGGTLRSQKMILETKVWDVTDEFLVKKDRAFAAAARLLWAGGDELYLIGGIAKTIRSILALSHAGERGTQYGEVMKKLRLHPYVLKKLVEISRRVSMSKLIACRSEIFKADFNIKTGRLPASLAFLNLFVRS